MNIISNAALAALTNIGLSQEQLLAFKAELATNLAANAAGDAVTVEDVADLKAIVASHSADLQAINDALVNPDLDGPATVDAIATVTGTTPVLDGGVSGGIIGGQVSGSVVDAGTDTGVSGETGDAIVE
jgi:hypothetical protein